jgi:hypothetical protein
MSLATVRGAIAAYLNFGTGTQTQDAAIPGLNKVFRAQPTFIDPTQWWILPPELGAGTVGYLHLAKVDEDRIAFPAVEGQKMVGYIVVLVLIYRYQIPSGTQATPYEGDEWIDGQDETVEAIKAWIRKDPTLGTAQTTQGTGVPGVIYGQYPGAIWEAGQDKGDLSMTADPPVRDEEGGEVLSFQILEFHAYEVITA